MISVKSVTSVSFAETASSSVSFGFVFSPEFDMFTYSLSCIKGYSCRIFVPSDVFLSKVFIPITIKCKSYLSIAQIAMCFIGVQCTC